MGSPGVISLIISFSLYCRTLEKYEREAKEKSRESWYLSWCMDTNLEGEFKKSINRVDQSINHVLIEDPREVWEQWNQGCGRIRSDPYLKFRAGPDPTFSSQSAKKKIHFQAAICPFLLPMAWHGHWLMIKSWLACCTIKKRSHLFFRAVVILSVYATQCCGSGMFIPDAGSKNSNKREGWKKTCCQTFFCSRKFHKMENYCIFTMLKNKIWANFQRIVELFSFYPKNCH